MFVDLGGAICHVCQRYRPKHIDANVCMSIIFQEMLRERELDRRRGW